MKADVAILVATFLRFKREGYQPARDLILALTSDEEGGKSNGVQWLVENRRDLIDAEFCINPDGGGASLRGGKRRYLSIQAAEKVYLSFKLEVTNSGGHSSLPTRENAIYTLAAGLSRLAKLEFPVRLFDITRTGFERRSQIFDGQLAADMRTVAQNPEDAAAVARLSAIPVYNALMRTTCVATMLAAGHADNALPQTATAIVNCRLLPIDDPAQVEAVINRTLADPAIHVSPTNPPKPSPPSPIDLRVLKAVTSASDRLWPSIPLIPEMSTGGTDGLWLRRAGIPTYGISGIFLDEDDIRAHGRDERVPVESFYQEVDFMYDFCARVGKLQ
jgi:acetylornithine deacetylase/succinyl-diaminopimelate desuccinylase-like protein